MRNCDVAMRIYRQLCVLEKTVELARTTGLTTGVGVHGLRIWCTPYTHMHTHPVPQDVLNKGQMIRFWSMLCRTARSQGYLVPTDMHGDRETNTRMVEGM